MKPHAVVTVFIIMAIIVVGIVSENVVNNIFEKYNKPSSNKMDNPTKPLGYKTIQLSKFPHLQTQLDALKGNAR